MILLPAQVTPDLIAKAQARAPQLFAVPWHVSALRGLTAAVVVLYLLWAIAGLGLTWERFLLGFSKLGDVLRLMVPPSDGGFWADFVEGLSETLAMAFIGTFAAALIAVPLGFIGAKTVVANPLIHFFIRRFFDVFRATPALIWALIFITAVGLGPMAGVLALILSDFAALSKLYAEAIENADKRPVEGVVSSGAGGLLALRFGVLPQVLPIMLSQALYFFESNVRSAAIFGIVGAGGIGFHLNERIRLTQWDQAAFIILMFLVTVFIIDQMSYRIRRSLIAG
ncbi:MAG TPA: phosphonate ABC transporter, permease protein PhnE [Alphaproteobacteria bacterium]|nr:phosphonate ABC transporter, permease protein PhnE [Alphaproteobacteria bacterium]